MPNEQLIETADRLISYTIADIVSDGQVGQLQRVCSALLEENKQLSELQSITANNCEKLQTELEQVKAELSAKDKVLELYASGDMYTVLHLGCSPMVMADRGGQARSILSQYEVKHENK